jgi:hypothetical protein
MVPPSRSKICFDPESKQEAVRGLQTLVKDTTGACKEPKRAVRGYKHRIPGQNPMVDVDATVNIRAL